MVQFHRKFLLEMSLQNWIFQLAVEGLKSISICTHCTILNFYAYVVAEN